MYSSCIVRRFDTICMMNSILLVTALMSIFIVCSGYNSLLNQGAGWKWRGKIANPENRSILKFHTHSASSLLAWSPNALVERKSTPDFIAPLNYLVATFTQVAGILVALHVLQIKVLPMVSSLASILPFLPSGSGDVLRSIFVGFFAFFMSIRSRLFSPLDNSRPKAANTDKVFQRLRPWWQPPPIAFPIIWTTIAFLRTFAMVRVFNAKQTLLCEPIFAFMTHLSIGDTWNTINNVESRLGTSAVTVPAVLVSAAYTTMLYSAVDPLAGKLLAPSVVWLSIANVLVVSIYRLNRLSVRSSLFPSLEEGPRASWKWFAK